MGHDESCNRHSSDFTVKVISNTFFSSATPFSSQVSMVARQVTAPLSEVSGCARSPPHGARPQVPNGAAGCHRLYGLFRPRAARASWLRALGGRRWHRRVYAAAVAPRREGGTSPAFARAKPRKSAMASSPHPLLVSRPQTMRRQRRLARNSVTSRFRHFSTRSGGDCSAGHAVCVVAHFAGAPQGAHERRIDGQRWAS